VKVNGNSEVTVDVASEIEDVRTVRNASVISREGT
jgi:hypothetical protein